MKALKHLNAHPVEQLAAKLTSVDIPDEIIREADEQLRVTNIQIKTGSLGGPKIDREDLRAAIILEHVFRQRTKQRIPMKILAKAAGVKHTKLEELTKKLMHYLQPTETAVGSARVTRATDSAPSGSVATKHAIPNPFAPSRSDLQQASQPSSTKRQTASARRSILPELSIRLASKVLDPHGCVQAAQRLLDDIHKHIHTSTSFAINGQLYDLKRFEVAYEAAAFYYFAIRQQQTGEGTKSAKASRRNSDAAFDTLDIRDLEAASSDVVLAEVKDTLKKVEQWAKQFEANRIDGTNGSAATKKSMAASGSTKKKRPRESISPATDTQEDILGISMESATVEDAVNLESQREAKRHSAAQWRTDILADAIQQAKQRLSLDCEDGQTIDDDACLEDAANQVFAKYGLLVPNDNDVIS